MRPAVLMAAASLIFTGCVSQRGFPPEHQIVNFDQVSPGLYRGGQPTAASIGWLQSQGVRSVLNLRNDPAPFEEGAVVSAGMAYSNAPMSGVSMPTPEHVNAVLSALEALPGPVFVHCQYGCDRTGLIVACWRIRHGWTPAAALAEAKVYGISPLLPQFRQFIREFK